MTDRSELNEGFNAMRMELNMRMRAWESLAYRRPDPGRFKEIP